MGGNRMKKFTLTVALFGLLMFCLAIPVGASSTMWSQTYGGADWDSVESVIQTSDGGYALAGMTRSFGSGGYDFWLVKTDSLGNVEWNKTYGVGKASSMVQTSDGGYALAGPPLVKTDSEGNMQWNQTYGEYWSGTTSVIQTSDNGYALAGTGIIVILDAPSDSDAWLIKTDSEGIIPEFPSWTPLLIMLLAVVAVALIYRRSLHKHDRGRRSQ
jgi:hypothetical protein